MIVSNSRKLIYLRVPRTGSTSLSNFLIENLVFNPDTDFHTPVPYNRIAGLNFPDADWVHATLSDICRFGILRHPLEDYLIYGIVRDPVDRFLSSAWHASRQQGIETRDNDQAVTYALQMINPKAPIFRPQSDWLVHEGKPINRIFPYEHLDRLAQEVLGTRDARVTFRHRAETRTARNSALDVGLRRRILDLYGNDQVLYQASMATG